MPRAAAAGAAQKRRRAASGSTGEGDEEVSELSLEGPGGEIAAPADAAALVPVRANGLYVCHCGKTFPSSTRYHKHVKLHSDERLCRCTFPGCGKSFKRKTHLDRHMASHQDERPWPCPEPGCGKSFATRQRLTKHQVIHQGLQCEICGSRFRKKCQLEQHRQAHLARAAARRGGGQLGPPGPADAAAAAPALLADAPGALGPGSRSADGAAGPAAEALPPPPPPVAPPSPAAGSEDGGSSAADSSQGLCCPECGLAVKDAQALRMHLYKHHRLPPEKAHQCDKCEESFRFYQDLVIHRREQHPKCCICHDCGKAYRREQHLAEHRKRVHAEVVQLCPIPGCGMSFTSASNLRVHHRAVHSGQRPFVCRHCNVAFAYRHVLRRHLRLVHGSEGPPRALDDRPAAAADAQLDGCIDDDAGAVPPPPEPWRDPLADAPRLGPPAPSASLSHERGLPAGGGEASEGQAPPQQQGYMEALVAWLAELEAEDAELEAQSRN